MCTALTYKNGKYTFMGRNYDYEISYDETVTVTPRKYPFTFSNLDSLDSHYAIMGITANIPDYPLYYDAVNEKGLAMAGLNFPCNAHYTKPAGNKINLSSFELIPYMLSSYANIDEVKNDIGDFNITDESYSKELPNSPLHWLVADNSGESLVVEQTCDGLDVYENPVGVLTNNPVFAMQMSNLENYSNVSPRQVPAAHDGQYSRGTGSIGLPGDLTSMGRFARAVWMKNNSKTINGDYNECISQFFHILASVEQIYGCTQLDEDEYEYTIYTDCYDLRECILYYKDYYEFAPAKYRMHDYDLDGNELIFCRIKS